MQFALSAAAQERDVSRETLETMRQHVVSLRAVSRSSALEAQPLELVPAPVLRYSDPGGITTDASVWVWGSRGRPAIVAGVFYLTQEGRNPKDLDELVKKEYIKAIPEAPYNMKIVYDDKKGEVQIVPK